MDSNKPILDSIIVDASCIGNPGPVEYKGLNLWTRKVIFKHGPYAGGTNNIGEFIAIVHALAYCKINNLNLPIYSDSQTAIAWIRHKESNTTMLPSEKNKELLSMLERANKWLKTNTFKNEVLKWNTAQWGEIPADYGRKI